MTLTMKVIRMLTNHDGVIDHNAQTNNEGKQ